MVLQRDKVRRQALELAGVFDQHDPVGGFRDLGEKSVGEGRLAGRGAARDQDVAALGHRQPQDRGLSGGHDAGGGVVVEREDRDRGFADRERRRRHDRRKKSLEPLSRLGQLRRDPRRAGMDLGADMVGDEPNDPFAVGRRQPLSRIGEPARQPVDPEPPVGVQHHLDDAWVFEEGGDRRSERGAQHARAARDRLGLEGMNRHPRPRSEPIEEGDRRRG